MKKLAFLSVMIIMLVTFTGCKKGNVSIKTSQIETNTMLIKSDGKVQVATVEDFAESYYDLDELKDFINKNLAEFNKKTGNEKAVVLDSLDKRDKKAIMILEYENMDYYAQFNEVDAKLLTKVTESDLSDLPDTLNGQDESDTITKDHLLDLEDVNVVILNEKYELMTGKKVKYYSNNATLKDSKTVQTSETGTTVVVY